MSKRPVGQPHWLHGNPECLLRWRFTRMKRPRFIPKVNWNRRWTCLMNSPLFLGSSLLGKRAWITFARKKTCRKSKRDAFRAHIALAKKHDLALQIHDRDAHDDVVAILKEVGAPERTVFHCFSGDGDLAEILAREGWYASFSGTVTFKNSVGLRDALTVMPRSRILIETDTPFLTPMPFRGKPNSPYMIPYTLRAMAHTLDMDESLLAAQLTSNTQDVYGRFDDEPLAAPDSVIREH